MASWDEDEGRAPTFAKSGRFGRLAKMGTLAASVAGSAIAKRLGSSFKSDEERSNAVKDSLVGNAQKVVKTMGEMKGAAMKLGQMLSVAPEGLPREFLEELKSLQKESPPMPYEMVAGEVEKALGRPLVEVFRYFDPKPIGAASIGQVHKARLFDGREVAVKVQYPGIADTLDADLKNIGSMLTMARVIADKDRLDAYLEEVRKGILEEADYALEARNLKKYGARLAKHPSVAVPEVIEDLSASSVLTMSFVQGEKLDVALDAIQDRAERDRIGWIFSTIFIWMFHEENIIHADPHPGNFLLTPDRKIGFLDFGCFREYDPEFCDGWIDILVAKWRHEKDRLPAIYEKLGFRPMKGSEGLSAAQLNEFAEIILAPFLYDREFDWGDWKPQKRIETFVKGNLSFLQFAAPPQAVFYFRVAGGVWGFLQRSKIRGNWYRVAQETARKRGRF